MENKISVIIPVYNVEKFIERCIDSVINQSYRNLEIILIDDGSSDMCPQICDEYSKRDNRISVIHKKNGGLSDARNAGLDIATGDFVIFVDSDDYIDLTMCEKLISLVKEDTDVIAYRFMRFFDNGNLEKIDNSTGEIVHVEGDEIFKNYIKRKYFTHMVTDKMFKTSLFSNVRFIKGRLAEDMAICYQLIGKARSAIYVDNVYYYYYTRTNSIMGTGSLKLCIDAYKGENEAYEYGNKYFKQLRKYNDIRYLNQSMKVYLKLLKMHNLNKNDSEMVKIQNNISLIKRKGMPLSTTFFYYVFKINKNFAWLLYKLFNLT